MTSMEGKQVDGRSLRLDFAAPRGSTPGSGSGGFRGGGRGGGRGGRGGRGGSRGGGRGRFFTLYKYIITCRDLPEGNEGTRFLTQFSCHLQGKN